MAQVDRIVAAMRQTPNNVRFSDLTKVCEHYFGEARQRGTTHRVYKTPWPGDPRVNVQEDKGGKAKVYQVKQVLAARKDGRMNNHEHYTYRVTWSQEDGEYVGLCAEFPSLSWLDENLNDALVGIVNLVKDIMVDMLANGESIPEPLAEKQYSGKFQVRIPPHQHRLLAMRAAEEGVSLNRYVSAKLAE